MNSNLKPATFSPNGSLYISNHLENPPFIASNTHSFSPEYIQRLRALAGITVEDTLKNSILIRSGSSTISSSSSSSSSSDIVFTTNKRLLTDNEEHLSNMYSWLHLVGQQLLLPPSPLGSTSDTLSLKSITLKKSSNATSTVPFSSLGMLDLQTLFSQIGREYDSENEKNTMDEKNDKKRERKSCILSKEIPCGPLTAYVGSQREAALTLCGWSPLSFPLENEDSMIDVNTGEPFTAIEALAASIPIPLIKTCCLAWDTNNNNSKEEEEGDIGIHKQTGIERNKQTGIERSAALALFHGYSSIAVQLLQLTASSIQEKLAYSSSKPSGSDNNMQHPIYKGPSSSHAELLQLVAMAAAGCPGPVVNRMEPTNTSINSVNIVGQSQSISSSLQKNTIQQEQEEDHHHHHPAQNTVTTTTLQRDATRSIWLSSCKALLNKIDGQRHPYLKVMLMVLVEVADPAINTRVTPMPDKLSDKLSNISSPISDKELRTEKWAPHSSIRNTPHRIDTLYPRLYERQTNSDQYTISSPKSSLLLLSSPSTLKKLEEEGTRNNNVSSTPIIPLPTSSLIISESKYTKSSDDSLMMMKVAPPEDQIEISLQDRVAFACRFLDDLSLAPYIKRITHECCATGRIDGLLLTGLTPRGANLVQTYLDRVSSLGSGDIQTAAIVGVYFLRSAQLLMVQRIKIKLSNGISTSTSSSSTTTTKTTSSSFSVYTLLTPQELFMVRKAWRWIIDYRTLLNRWQLWSQRALFDVQRAKILGYMYKPGKTTSEGGGLGPLGILGPSSSPSVISMSLETIDVYSEQGITELIHACCLSLSSIDGVCVPKVTPLMLEPSLQPILGVVSTSLSSTSSFSSTSSSTSSSSSFSPSMPMSSSYQLSLTTLPLNNQAFLRCSSCHTSLHLPSLVEHSATAVEWLRKQRPRMLLCPSCGKSLPRCELCLLPLGCINPVMQLQHELSVRNGSNGRVSIESGKLRDSSRLEDFWSFCTTCKHGGHSLHLAEWFATRTVCPVAECMCHCALQDRR